MKTLRTLAAIAALSVLAACSTTPSEFVEARDPPPALMVACVDPLPPPEPVSHGAARAYAAMLARSLAACREEAYAATTHSARAPRTWK